MDFTLSSEQEMLRDSVRKFVSSELSFETRQLRLASTGPDDTWARFAEFGWLAMPVPEADDGLGSSVADLVLMCEELGRGLCVKPFVEHAVLPARLLAAAGSAACREALAGLAAGQHRVAVAAYEKGRRFDVIRPETTAVRQEDGSYRLTGSKILVTGGANADGLAVIARVDARQAGVPEVAVMLMDAGAPGVTRRGYRALDDVEMADVSFEDVAVPADGLLAFGCGAIEAIERAFDEAVVCQCADAVGAMSRALELTVEYLHLRRQFGKTLSEFQALQHAVAELFIEVSDAKSMLYQAAGALERGIHERRKAVSGCKIKVSGAAKQVTGTAIHLHGGIGVTSEYPVGHYLRRVMVAERLYGDHQYHLERYLSQHP
jgi:acyl-CoA dehydrogenase